MTLLELISSTLDGVPRSDADIDDILAAFQAWLVEPDVKTAIYQGMPKVGNVVANLQVLAGLEQQHLADETPPRLDE